jgi:hypothetical protein
MPLAHSVSSRSIFQLGKKIIQVGNCAFPAWKKIYSSWKTVFFNLENATLDIARIFLQ